MPPSISLLLTLPLFEKHDLKTIGEIRRTEPSLIIEKISFKID